MENRADTLTTIEQLEQQNAEQKQQIAELTAKLKWYEEQFRLAQQKRFGASSENTSPDKMELNLFNEAEVLTTPKGQQEPPMEKVTYERQKTTGKREAGLERLPVETITYTLSETDQVCSCCGGALHEMSTETRSEIAIVPPQVKVIRHVRQVYSCRHCEREEIQTPIVTAPMPRPVYPGSLASPSLLAHVMCQKYAEQWLMPVVAEMKRHLLNQEVLHADETTLQVLQEPGKSTESASYLWLYRTGRGVQPAVV